MTTRFDRLEAGQPITSDGQGPSISFQWWAQKLLEQVEGALAAIEQVNEDQSQILADLAEAQDDIVQALENAGIALAAAEAADAKAVAAAREAARINSYTQPTSVLTAVDVGADCTITVAAHARVYPVQGSIDVADLAVTGGTITGQPFSTGLYVYYDDTTLANTAPTYVATTSAATAQVGAAAGRHFVGFVTTPADGGSSSSGSGGTPPGGGGGNPIP